MPPRNGLRCTHCHYACFQRLRLRMGAVLGYRSVIPRDAKEKPPGGLSGIVCDSYFSGCARKRRCSFLGGDRETHPRMNTALVLDNSFVMLDERGTGSGRNEEVIFPRRLRNQLPVHDFGTFRCGNRITRSGVKKPDKSPTKLLDFGEGVSFAAQIL